MSNWELRVGIVASMAFNAQRDLELTSRDVSHLFGANSMRLAFRKSSYLRGFVLQFIDMFAPDLDLDKVTPTPAE